MIYHFEMKDTNNSHKIRSVPRGADHIFLEKFYSIFLETAPFCKAFIIYKSKIGGERDVGTTKNLMTKIYLNL